MSTVAIVSSQILTRPIGGATNFEAMLLEQIWQTLHRDKDQGIVVFARIQSEQYFKDKRKSLPVIFYHYRRPLPTVVENILSLVGVRSLRLALKSVNCHYVISLGPYSFKCAQQKVSIIWDLSHLESVSRLPEFSLKRQFFIREERIRSICKESAIIVTGTSCLAKKISARYDFDESRIVVIPMPVNNKIIRIAESLPVSRRNSEHVIFYPAQLWPHKNHSRLLRAWAYAKSQLGLDGSWVLRLYGSDQLNRKKKLERLACMLNISDTVQFKGYVSDDRIHQAYRRFHALIYPSLLGPDNIPPVEAYVTGIFASVSDIGAHREQTANKLLYHNPLSVYSIAEHIVFLSRMNYESAVQIRNVECLTSSQTYLEKLLLVAHGL
jgi:glycosyltransferase involved in cell wall biosynthesis